MLPIYDIRPQLKDALRRGNRLIVSAPTGSGKSTQIPQMLLDDGLAGNGQIVVLQPRRLAARMLAARVASERHTDLGREVGYQVRFENRCGRDTRIKFETDGILLRQLVADSRLSGVSAILFDEFHERHLYGDVMLGLALRLQETTRPDLKLVVMSATLDSQKLVNYLGSAARVESSGRMYPVDIEYLPKTLDADEERIWVGAAREFSRLVLEHPEGDVLVFMPGAYEIQRTMEAIAATRAGRESTILPLHGELSPGEQDAVFCDFGKRKVVVATNVAETSLTIDGIRVVIDSGLARKARFDPYRGINTLLIEKISRASADQRAGRAGRTAPGCCLRLWTQRDHEARPAQEPPEVRRVDLSEIVLHLKALGVEDVATFPWLDPPGERTLARATELLVDLGALSGDGAMITGLGRRMLAFPVHPRHARMLIEAGNRGCVTTVALIAALTQMDNIILRGRGREVRERRADSLGDEATSDLLGLVRAWQFARKTGFDVSKCDELGIHARAARQTERALEQFVAIAKEQGIDTAERGVSSETIRRCVLAGFVDHLARRAGRASIRYDVVHRRRGTLDKESGVRDAELIVAADVREIGTSAGEAEVRLSLVTVVEQEWLSELFPADIKTRRKVDFDSTQKRVRVEEEVVFRDLVIATGRAGDPSDEEAAGVLATEIAEGRIVLRQWDHDVEQWITRLNRLTEWCPELGLPALTQGDRRHLFEQVCLGARGAKDVKERAVWPAVKGWLSAPQVALLEQHAPERITLSNGRTPKVIYDAANPPYVAVQIQHLYGVRKRITIAMKRVNLLIHILAPSQRPVQITDDLSSFWDHSYAQVKKELQRKYPKHEWR